MPDVASVMVSVSRAGTVCLTSSAAVSIGSVKSLEGEAEDTPGSEFEHVTSSADASDKVGADNCVIQSIDWLPLLIDPFRVHRSKVS